jgi:hypothetical protein
MIVSSPSFLLLLSGVLSCLWAVCLVAYPGKGTTKQTIRMIPTVFPAPSPWMSPEDLLHELRRLDGLSAFLFFLFHLLSHLCGVLSCLALCQLCSLRMCSVASIYRSVASTYLVLVFVIALRLPCLVIGITCDCFVIVTSCVILRSFVLSCPALSCNYLVLSYDCLVL